MCAFRGANFSDLASPENARHGGADPADQVHEFMLLRFAADIGPALQPLIMEAVGHHLCRCEGLVAHEFFRGEAGDWVEHVVWASQSALEGSEGIEDEPVLDQLFDCFDTRSVSYLRGRRVEPQGLGAPLGSGQAISL
jgi:hypothetical protein